MCCVCSIVVMLSLLRVERNVNCKGVIPYVLRRKIIESTVGGGDGVRIGQVMG